MAKKGYGHFGFLTRHQWKRMLKSNDEIFKPCPKKFKVLGPHVTKEYGLTGNMMALESSVFGMNATPKQMEFMQELIEQNPVAWREYVLHITNTLSIWEEDIKEIEELERDLEEADEIEHAEKLLLERGEKLSKGSERTKRLFDRHPELFSNSPESISKAKQDAKQARELIHAARLKVEQDIEILRKEVPFAFE